MEKDTLQLFSAIMLLKTKKETQNFFEDLLTPAEIKEFANRWKVAQMLANKVPYEEIVSQTSMSTTTIARISKWLTKGRGGYKTMIKRINQTENHHNRSLAV